MRLRAALAFLLISFFCVRACGETLQSVAAQVVYVSSSVSLDLSGGEPGSVTYRATGLPNGLTLDPNTGRVTGAVIAKPGSYPVKYWSQSRLTKGLVRTVTFTVKPFPARMVGTFESLLIGYGNGTRPIGKIQINVTSTGAYTGTLVTLYENKVYALRGQLSLNADRTAAENRLIIQRRAGPLVIDPTFVFPPDTSFSVSIAIQADSVFDVELSFIFDPATLMAVPMGVSFDGIAILPQRTRKTDWSGRYSLSLRSRPYSPFDEIDPYIDLTEIRYGDTRPRPLGSGFATATVAANGETAIKGKTADGTLFTALLASGSDASYRAFIKPYKTDGSYLGGWINLIRLNEASAAKPVYGSSVDGEFYWEKRPALTDSSYPQGFGPVFLEIAARRWESSVSMAGTFPMLVDHAGFSNAAPNPDRLPVSLSFTTKYVATLAAPSDPANPAKWKLKVDRSTGVFTGSFVVSREVNGRATTLAVPVEGVLVQPFSSYPEQVIGAGFFLVPPNNDSGASTVSGSLQILSR